MLWRLLIALFFGFPAVTNSCGGLGDGRGRRSATYPPQDCERAEISFPTVLCLAGVRAERRTPIVAPGGWKWNRSEFRSRFVSRPQRQRRLDRSGRTDRI